MKLDSKTKKAIRDALNASGWRGYRKELAERVDMDADEINDGLTFNCARYEDNDLYDKMSFDEWGAVDLDPINGITELDVWLYRTRGGWTELVDTASVWVCDLGNNKVAAYTKEPDASQILQSAVAAAARR